MGVAAFVLWLVNAAVSFLLPVVNNARDSTGTFRFFVLINVASIKFVFVFVFVPEMNERSLESLEADFRGVHTSAVTTVYW